jgi:hypothetical protein
MVPWHTYKDLLRHRGSLVMLRPQGFKPFCSILITGHLFPLLLSRPYGTEERQWQKSYGMVYRVKAPFGVSFDDFLWRRADFALGRSPDDL